MNRRRLLLWHLMAIALCLLFGCVDNDHTDGHHEEHDHPHHHTPDHKPADYGAAVRALDARFVDLLNLTSGGDKHQLEHELSELIDILRWLPELAAETDLPEPEWNQVNAISMELLSQFEPLAVQLHRGQAVELGSLKGHWKKSIAQLRSLEPPIESLAGESEP